SGGDTATLTATSTKPAATASVTLKGTGGVANVQISPASKDFGSTSGSQTFTATNNGNISTGTYAFSGPSDSHFGLTGTNTCNGTALAPSGSCSFTIAFTAPAGCGAEPTLYQDSASLGSYASATVKGEQEQCLPALAWSPCSPNIPGCWFFINSIDSTPYTLTLTNNGQAAT